MNDGILARLLSDHPIVITGMGSVCAAGECVAALWQAAAAGQGLARWNEFQLGDTKQSFAVCRAPQLDLTRAELRPVRKMDRCVQLGWLAANEAWRQADPGGAYPASRLGVMIGSSRGPLGKIHESFTRLGEKNYPPSLSADSTFAVLSGVLAQQLKLNGPGAAISATCASSAFALGLAAEQILLGKADGMLVGGAEAPVHPLVLAQLQAAGVLGSHEAAPKTCRPFDAARDGMVLGEGSAFLMLESARTATARGAKVLARFAGWGLGLDNSGRTGVDETGAGLLLVMQQALKLARLAPEQIGYINAHGTGTKLNDVAEAHAVRRLLGSHAAMVPCSSTKPVTGHCLGATPALEAVICIEALRRQIVPPNANLSHPDPHCPLEQLPVTARPASISTVISNSLGFWGHHAALLFTHAA